jgi:protein involved in polysaccharide export with SLBB domain
MDWMQSMKRFQLLARSVCALFLAATFGLLLSGCGGSSSGSSDVSAGKIDVPEYHLRPGDHVTIAFSGLDAARLPPDHKERIKDDGTITLHLIGSINAAGKTTGELQKEIQSRYVPDYYKQQLTVTVKADELFFTVGGEVRKPDRYVYVNGITVVGAVHAAGGFTDFAKESHVEVRRANGKVLTVHYKKAVRNRSEDQPVFPGDTVTVAKTIIW